MAGTSSEEEARYTLEGWLKMGSIDLRQCGSCHVLCKALMISSRWLMALAAGWRIEQRNPGLVRTNCVVCVRRVGLDFSV